MKIWIQLKWPLHGFAEELVNKQCKGGTAQRSKLVDGALRCALVLRECTHHIQGMWRERAFRGEEPTCVAHNDTGGSTSPGSGSSSSALAL